MDADQIHPERESIPGCGATRADSDFFAMLGTLRASPRKDCVLLAMTGQQNISTPTDE